MAKVLVVDDARLVRITLREFLRDADYDVGVAEDADRAREMMADEEFDVILADIVMPRVTGVGLLKAIKETSPDIEVILMTAEPTVETASEAVRAGAFDYLSKPVDKEQLLKIIANAARVKFLGDEGRRLEEENRQNRENLGRLVEERTVALRESQERMELALAGADLGTWDWNVRTGEVTVDQRWAAKLGYSLDEIEQDLSGWERLVEPDDMPGVQNALDAHLEGKTEYYETEHRVRNKSGDSIWVLDKGRVIERDAEGNPLRACGTHLDITDRRRAEKERQELEVQFRQSQKMEAVGQLATGVSHDFNNILSVIMGTAELLHKALEIQPAHELMPKMLKDVSQIINDADRAAGLIRQLLAFSRRQVVQPRVLDLNQVVQGLEKMLRRLLIEDIHLTMRLSDNLRCIRADAGQIERVVVNLVVNARDAMATGGDLTLETGGVVLDEAYVSRHIQAQLGPHVVLAVSDTGCGMDTDTMERIFEPFFTTKAVGQGTGLGLATVHGIVSQAGGHVRVDSEPGQGTSFRVLVPAIDARTAQVAASASIDTPPGGTETVLLCEDDESLRRITERLLRGAGYLVLAAEEGGDLLSRLARYTNPVHLLVTDVVMRDMNGRQLAERLATTHPQVRVLYVSGYTSSIISEHGVLSDGVEFLEKPFKRSDLLRRVREVLDRTS